MVSPIAIGATIKVSRHLRTGLARSFVYGGLQLGRSKFLHDVPRLCIKYPEQCLVRESRYLFPYSMNVVDRVALG